MTVHDGRSLVAALSFVALLGIGLVVVALVEGGRARRRQAARLAEVRRYRLHAAASEAGNRGGPTAPVRYLLGVVDRSVRRNGRRERLVGELDRAGLRLRPEEWALLQLFAVLLPAAIGTALLSSVIGALVGGILGLVGARLWLRRRVAKRAQAFADQLPEALRFVAVSLRTGLSLPQALTSVVRDGTEPCAGEIARALAEARLGVDIEDALEATAERMACEDLRWVVLAIRIAREVGGNLAEVIGTTVETMRQRAELVGQVKVLTAEGRTSAKVLFGLPFVVAAFDAVMRPGSLDPLFSTGAGAVMLAVGLVLITVGGLWLRKLTRIEV